MPTNDFLPIATSGGANVETQAAFAADTATLNNGFTSGLASSLKFNKVWRQSSIMSSVIAQYINSITGANTTDDGTTATLLANFAQSVRLPAYAKDTSATVNVITAAISPAPLALTDGMTVHIVPAITNTGAVTFSLNGLTTHPVVNYSGAFTGGELIAGKPYTFTYNLASTTWYVTSSAGGSTQTAADARYAGAMPNFTASTTAALISASLGIGKVDFRNAVLATGTPVEYNVTTALTLAMTDIAGSLGSTTTVATSLIYAIVYAAGTPQLAVANISGGLQMDETNLITTTAIGAGSTAANVWYSTSAIATPSQYRIIGRVDATWTSGTGWSSPTLVQPVGVGEALTGLSSLGYGQAYQYVTRTSQVIYYNTTGRPISISIDYTEGTSGDTSLTINGATIATSTTGSGGRGQITGTIPPFQSYVVNDRGTNTHVTYELR